MKALLILLALPFLSLTAHAETDEKVNLPGECGDDIKIYEGGLVHAVMSCEDGWGSKKTLTIRHWAMLGPAPMPADKIVIKFNRKGHITSAKSINPINQGMNPGAVYDASQETVERNIKLWLETETWVWR